ncbi:cell division protein FtsZ [uncultured Helicobacter sp.]|uniref:cell division protein FtsZ n=1 Tax=uncultured Helicobacter sp. TaxID=175537 RepID=UPI00374E7767
MESNILDIQELGSDVAMPEEGRGSIAVIGVGGGGCNTINYLISHGIHPEVMVVAANTDAQHLRRNKALIKLQLGKKTTKGLGAGADPEQGNKAAVESEEEIRELLKGYDIVFIATGLGGGTGTGAAPVIAKIVRELGALVISIATTPFKYEGKKRAKIAEVGKKELKAQSDCIIIIPNDRISPKGGIGNREAMAKVDSVLANAVKGLANTILSGGGINIDYSDVKTIMGSKGLAVMGMGEAQGANAVSEALNNALSSEMMGNINVTNARGILVCLEIHPDYSQEEIQEVLERIEEYQAEETDYKCGIYGDESFPRDYVRITFIATGFADEVVEPSIAQESVESLKMTSHHNPTPPISQSKDLRHASGGDGITEIHYDMPTFIRQGRD